MYLLSILPQNFTVNSLINRDREVGWVGVFLVRLAQTNHMNLSFPSLALSHSIDVLFRSLSIHSCTLNGCHHVTKFIYLACKVVLRVIIPKWVFRRITHLRICQVTRQTATLLRLTQILLVSYFISPRSRHSLCGITCFVLHVTAITILGDDNSSKVLAAPPMAAFTLLQKHELKSDFWKPSDGVWSHLLNISSVSNFFIE